MIKLLRLVGLAVGALGIGLLTMPIANAQAPTPIPAITPTPSAAPILVNIYRAESYSLDYPADWKITPRTASETFFGTTAAPVCGQPGLIVTLLGPTADKTADILLDDYTANNSYLTSVGERDDANDLGRVQVFRGPCTDGSTRLLRVAMYVAFGSGYRLTAYAPKAAYPQWDAAFQQIESSFSVTAADSLGTTQAPVQAPAHAPDTLLLHIFNGNVYMANVADFPGAPLTQNAVLSNNTRRYLNPRISPDGKNTAFVKLLNQAPFGTLYVAPIAANSRPAPLPPTVDPAFPLAWSPDGTEIAFVAPGDSPQAPLTVRAMRLDTLTSRTLGTLPVSTCALSTSDDPATAAWLADLSAISPAGDTLVLDWPTTNTLLVSAICQASGVSQLDVGTGKITPLTDISRTVLSADKSTLLGIAPDGVIFITLADAQSRSAPIHADRVAWNKDNHTIYYTTRMASNTPTPGAPSTPSATSTRYDLTLHMYNPTSTQDVTIFSGQGFGISSLAASPNGSGVLFTVIQNDLVQRPTTNSQDAALLRQQPAAQLYWLAMPYVQGETPTLLIDTLQPVFGPLGSTAVIGVPVTPHAGATNIPGG